MDTNPSGPHAKLVLFDMDDTLIPWQYICKFDVDLYTQCNDIVNQIQRELLHVEGWRQAGQVVSIPNILTNRNLPDEVRLGFLGVRDVLEQPLHMTKSPEQWAAIEHVLHRVDEIATRWIDHTREVLSKLITKRIEFVVVTACPLVPALSKLYLFGLLDLIPASAVISCFPGHKVEAFDHCRNASQRSSYHVLAVGDGAMEEQAASQLRMPFARIVSHTDLDAVLDMIFQGDFSRVTLPPRAPEPLPIIPINLYDSFTDDER